MNRERFLSRLRTGLASMKPEEIDDILSDYEEHFDNARREGRSEEELISTLGDPDILAENLLVEISPPVAAPYVTAHQQAPIVRKALIAASMLCAVIGVLELVHFVRGRSEAKYSNEKFSSSERKLEGDQVRVVFPGTVQYRPHDPKRIVVNGPPQLTNLVKVSDGTITFSGAQNAPYSDQLAVVVSGTPIKDFVVLGNARILLEDVDQETLSVDLKGRGSVIGSGKVDRFNLHAAGVSTAQLPKLVAQGIDVHIEGQGIATLAPAKEIRGTVRGDGTLYLTTQPDIQNVAISGSGKILRAK